MNLEFKQKRGLSSRNFLLKKDRIIIEIKTLGKINKYEIKLDQLGLDIQYVADNTLPSKIFLGFSIFFTIGSILALMFSLDGNSEIWIFNIFFGLILTLFNCLKHHQDDIFLLGPEVSIPFYRNIPDEKTVLDFIEKVKSQIKIFYKLKYVTIDDNISEHLFYQRINWLLDIEIITKEEFEILKNKFEKKKLLSTVFFN